MLIIESTPNEYRITARGHHVAFETSIPYEPRAFAHIAPKRELALLLDQEAALAIRRMHA